MDEKKALVKDDKAISTVQKKRKAGRKPGSKKTGGRVKGTPNKKTVWLKQELENINFCWGKEFKKALDLSEIAKLEVLISLLPYLNPKMKEKEVEETPQEEAQEKPKADVLKIIK